MKDNRKKYTPEQIEQAVTLREEGKLTLGQIAAKLGMNTNAVDYHCRRQGAYPPGWTPPPATAPGPAVYTDCTGRTVRRFQPAEDQRMLKLRADGMRISEIARTMERAPNSIVNRLMTLAARECAEVADA